jgi:hypothetical protein
LIVIANFAAAPRPAKLDGAASIELDSGMSGRAGQTVDLGSLVLGPDEALVLRSA